MSSVIPSNHETKMAVLKQDLMESDYYVSFHVGENPAYSINDNNGKGYKTVEEAKSAHQELAWQNPDEDDAGEIIAIAFFK